MNNPGVFSHTKFSLLANCWSYWLLLPISQEGDLHPTPQQPRPRNEKFLGLQIEGKVCSAKKIGEILSPQQFRCQSRSTGTQVFETSWDNKPFPHTQIKTNKEREEQARGW